MRGTGVEAKDEHHWQIRSFTHSPCKRNRVILRCSNIHYWPTIVFLYFTLCNSHCLELCCKCFVSCTQTQREKGIFPLWFADGKCCMSSSNHWAGSECGHTETTLVKKKYTLAYF